MKKYKNIVLFALIALCSGCVNVGKAKLTEIDADTDFLKGKKIKVEGFAYDYVTVGEMTTGRGFNWGNGVFSKVSFGTPKSVKSHRVNLYISHFLEDHGVNVREEDYELIIKGLIPQREYDYSVRYWCLDFPLSLITLQMYYRQNGISTAGIRVYTKDGEFLKAYQIQKKGHYTTIGLPLHTVGVFEYRGYPIALDISTFSCVNHCMNQFLKDYKNGEFK